MKRRGWLVLILAILAALLGIVSFGPVSAFLAQDRCLDGGGAWRAGECQGSAKG